jgi:hypothetical protein
VETSYVIERSTSLNGPFDKIGEVGINGRSYIDDTAKSGKTYYYRVRAFNGGIRSSPSNIAKIKAPSVSKAKPQAKKVQTASVTAPAGFPKVTSIFSTQPVSTENDLRKLLLTL